MCVRCVIFLVRRVFVLCYIGNFKRVFFLTTYFLCQKLWKGQIRIIAGWGRSLIAASLSMGWDVELGGGKVDCGELAEG